MCNGITVLLVNNFSQSEHWREIAAEYGYEVDRVISASGETLQLSGLTIGKVLEAKNAYRGRNYSEIDRAIAGRLVSYGHAVVLGEKFDDDGD